ncbi:MAG: hypothetical protein PHY03_07280 [Dehalococcoidia bacterium]|nr:hypothetical protein [Dehalococcoidia bacterium]
MYGTELITTIITATTALFGLMGVLVGIIIGKGLSAENIGKLTIDLASVFWIGILVITVAIVWFIGSHFGFGRMVTDIIWLGAALAFVVYLGAVYHLLRKVLKCF